MLTIILTVLIIVSAIFHIKAKEHTANFYIFKPLTMILIILMAINQPGTNSLSYKYLVIIGLLFSLVGDVLLMLPADRFVAGLVSFLIAHIFYIIAFILTGISFSSFFYLTPFLIYGGVLFLALLPHLKDMKVPVAIYSAFLLIMGWQALSRWMIFAPDGGFIAFIGALFFIASDSILAIDRFKGSVPNPRFYFMTTYFIAQWLIALSIR